ncbi:MAG: hypothetical protein LBL41_01810 [Bifidobacteriaceae bacterium]|nr:hypothetical protein [Bifidobacteriaceae bacterium]
MSKALARIEKEGDIWFEYKYQPHLFFAYILLITLSSKWFSNSSPISINNIFSGLLFAYMCNYCLRKKRIIGVVATVLYVVLAIALGVSAPAWDGTE